MNRRQFIKVTSALASLFVVAPSTAIDQLVVLDTKRTTISNLSGFMPGDIFTIAGLPEKFVVQSVV